MNNKNKLIYGPNIYLKIRIYMLMRYLITGGCGFSGAHLVEHILRNSSEDEIVVLDKLTYASRGLDRLKSSNVYDNHRVSVYTYDMIQAFSKGLIYEFGHIDYIIHTAASTHVDESIANPVETIHNNVMSTVNLLEYARGLKDLKCFLFLSTDEVMGPMTSHKFTETDPLRPANPYSASKAACESICLSYHNTYKIPIMIVRSMNMIGEMQNTEKFLPMIIKRILNDEEIDIHTDDKCETIGSRFYLHARTMCNALLFLLEKGKIGEIYHVAGEREVSNLELVEMVGKIIGKTPKYRLTGDISSRPGHDLKYGLDDTLLKSLGWTHPVTFEQSLKKKVEWTLKNKKWLDWSEWN
jgi:dTDP-glucose 4,6-dehydratase